MTSLENEITTAEAEFGAWHRKRNDALAEDFGLLTLTSFQWLATEPSAVDLVPGLWSADPAMAALNTGASDGFVMYDGGLPVRGILTQAVAERGQKMWVRGCGGPEEVAVELARRDGRYLIRTRAASTQAQQNFSGVPVFDFDPYWIIKGSYVPYDSPQVARISTARSDTSLTAVLAGEITFNHQGSGYRLRAEFEPGTGALRVTFHDATNGFGTAAWRFLDVPPPALEERYCWISTARRTTRLPSPSMRCARRRWQGTSFPSQSPPGRNCRPDRLRRWRKSLSPPGQQSGC